MTNESNNNKPTIGVPDWEGMVDQTNPVALANFISEMPFAKTITIEELRNVTDNAVELGDLLQSSVALTHGELLVEPSMAGREMFNCYGGTHASYGNFALFWSPRGAGDGPRPRPCFMFWDDEAVMLKAA